MLQDYLSFTRRDRIAIMVILLIILAVYFLPQFITSHSSPAIEQADTTWITALKKLEQKESASDQKKSYASSTYEPSESNRYEPVYDRPTVPKGDLFYFDPNTLSGDGWKKLGLRDKTIRTILNYLSKGGRFLKPGDLQKVYGLFPDEYERLVPYVRIAGAQETEVTEYDKPDEKPPIKTSLPRYPVMDINLADTTAFISLPGIGSKLAARIVNFREKLGGFYAIEQVGETFGLPDSIFQKVRQYLKLETAVVKKININTATEDELKAHPYIRFGLARPIVAYRKENGPFARLDDLMKVMAVTEATFKKIAPYLTL